MRWTLLAFVLLCAVSAGLLAVRHWYRAELVRAEYADPPTGMVFVPAGSFLIGSDDPGADHDEGPLREAFVEAFYIDRHEVTNAEFKAYDPDHAYAEGRDDYPVTGITLARAKAYAAWAGKRLPSVEEWEKAARGTDGRSYPWGREFEAGRANIVDGTGLEPVGQYPAGASPYGAEDMTGNAWEWVETIHRDSWLAGNQRLKREVIKGGAFSYGAYQGRASYNGFEPPGGTCNDVGFRCVKDAKPL